MERGYKSIGLKRGRTWLVSAQKMMTADGVISESVNDQNVAVYHYHPQNINSMTDLSFLRTSAVPSTISAFSSEDLGSMMR